MEADLTFARLLIAGDGPALAGLLQDDRFHHPHPPSSLFVLLVLGEPRLARERARCELARDPDLRSCALSAAALLALGLGAKEQAKRGLRDAVKRGATRIGGAAEVWRALFGAPPKRWVERARRAPKELVGDAIECAELRRGLGFPKSSVAVAIRAAERDTRDQKDVPTVCAAWERLAGEPNEARRFARSRGRNWAGLQATVSGVQEIAPDVRKSWERKRALRCKHLWRLDFRRSPGTRISVALESAAVDDARAVSLLRRADTSPLDADGMARLAEAWWDVALDQAAAKRCLQRAESAARDYWDLRAVATAHLRVAADRAGARRCLKRALRETDNGLHLLELSGVFIRLLGDTRGAKRCRAAFGRLRPGWMDKLETPNVTP